MPILPLPVPLSGTLSMLFDVSKLLFSHLGAGDKMHTLKEKEHLDLVFALNPLILAARFYSSSILCSRKWRLSGGHHSSEVALDKRDSRALPLTVTELLNLPVKFPQG